MTTGLLLIHAFPLDARMWEAQLSAFSGVLPVIAPHFPGFGGTESAGEVMTMDGAADKAAADNLDLLASRVDRECVTHGLAIPELSRHRFIDDSDWCRLTQVG